MATTLGGTSLAAGIFEAIESEPVTSYQRRMASGKLITDHQGNTKRRWVCSWRAITQSDVDTILTEYEDTTSQLFSPPDTASTYTVMVVRGSLLNPQIMAGSTARWNLSFEVEEV